MDSKNPYSTQASAGEGISAFPVIEHVVLDLETYVEAFVIHGGRRVVTLRILALLTGLLIVGLATFALVFALFLSATPAEPGAIIFASVVIVVGAMLCSYALFYRWGLRRGLRRQLGAKSQEINYEFHEDHLRIISDQQDLRFKWKAFQGYRCDRDIALIYQSESLFYVLPIGQFALGTWPAILSLLTAD